MPFRLDKLDLNVLMQLQNNARISAQEISRRIHLSANAVTARIRRLENEGYIKQYTTILNNAMVNRKLECITGVRLMQNNNAHMNAFLTAVKSIPEVYCCYHVNSMFDFMLHIVAIDVQDYHCFTKTLSEINCVSRITPLIILNEMDRPNVVDLSHLFSRFN